MKHTIAYLIFCRSKHLGVPRMSKILVWICLEIKQQSNIPNMEMVLYLR